MSTTIIKNGSAIKTVEFELRCLDQNGDAQDVHHFESNAEALAEAKSEESGTEYPAWVVEKHTSYRPAHLFTNPDIYVTQATGGNREALVEGGWVV